MRKLKLFTHCTILTTTPALFAYPEHPIPQATPQTVSWWGDWWWGDQEKEEEWVRPNTYDEIVQMLDDLESGELERRYSPTQLERINDYIATLAKEGILPNEFEEEAELEEDTYDLMYGEDSAFQLTCFLENSHEYMIIPAVFNGYSGYNIVQCGKISKAWKKTKKFCKKHKKAIIVGAVVVVAVTVVAVAVVQHLLPVQPQRRQELLEQQPVLVQGLQIPVILNRKNQKQKKNLHLFLQLQKKQCLLLIQMKLPS